MDELTLDDELYLSTKRAAKITGYAKDYVGQLCREGRVKARLVGRNWYVLDSSIREHRFGSEESKVSDISESTSGVTETPVQAEEKPISAAVSDWQAQYVTEPASEMSVIDESTAIEPENPLHDTSSVVQEMQSAWQDWFKRRDEMQLVEESVDEELLEAPKDLHQETEVAPESQDEAVVSLNRLDAYTAHDTNEDDWISDEAEDTIEDEEEVSIPINRSYASEAREVHSQQQEVEYTRVQPTYRRLKNTVRAYDDDQVLHQGGIVAGIVKVILIMASLGAIAIAVLGTGYLDFLFKRDSANYYPLQYLGGQSVVERK